MRGLKNDAQFRRVRDLLLSDFTYLEMRQSLFIRSAEIYRVLTKRGKTIRSPADCLIAACAIEESASLLEDDVDFHTIADVAPLKLVGETAFAVFRGLTERSGNPFSGTGSVRRLSPVAGATLHEGAACAGPRGGRARSLSGRLAGRRAHGAIRALGGASVASSFALAALGARGYAALLRLTDGVTRLVRSDP